MNEFKIQQKVYDMIQYGNLCLIQFPKSEKFVMAAEIRKSMYCILSLVVRANKKYYKKTTIQDLDIELEILKNFVRLSFDLKYINIKKYEFWSRQLDEIGKMIGGWIKSTK